VDQLLHGGQISDRIAEAKAGSRVPSGLLMRWLTISSTVRLGLSSLKAGEQSG
jgi:hypothetical protein